MPSPFMMVELSEMTGSLVDTLHCEVQSTENSSHMKNKN